MTDSNKKQKNEKAVPEGMVRKSSSMPMEMESDKDGAVPIEKVNVAQTSLITMVQPDLPTQVGKLHDFVLVANYLKGKTEKLKITAANCFFPFGFNYAKKELKLLINSDEMGKIFYHPYLVVIQRAITEDVKKNPLAKSSDGGDAEKENLKRFIAMKLKVHPVFEVDIEQKEGFVTTRSGYVTFKVNCRSSKCACEFTYNGKNMNFRNAHGLPFIADIEYMLDGVKLESDGKWRIVWNITKVHILKIQGKDNFKFIKTFTPQKKEETKKEMLQITQE